MTTMLAVVTTIDSPCLGANTRSRASLREPRLQVPLAISNFSSLVAVLTFGLTTQYSVAITARLLAGAFNSTFVYVWFCTSFVLLYVVVALPLCAPSSRPPAGQPKPSAGWACMAVAEAREVQAVPLSQWALRGCSC